MQGHPPQRFAVAPMMDWTDAHFRRFARICSRRALLYTEMVPVEGLWHAGAGRFLLDERDIAPVAVQFGGSDPGRLAHAAAQAEAYGYAEVNLNVGCPSDRVKSGRFGACLMAEPEHVAELVAAMLDATRLPVTVKTRIGIDQLDSYEHLARFVETVASAGCRRFIVHARKAWLSGLSPKENREIPPLDHGRVRRLKADFPHLEVVVNGGIADLDQALQLLDGLDGVMLGRSAYQNPALLEGVDRRLYGDAAVVRPQEELVRAYLPYVERRLAAGERLSRMARHLVGLFQGRPGARQWRRHLSEAGARRGAGVEVIEQALARVCTDEAPQPAMEAGG